jgi:3-deoxy-8-phosphooctulonate synthase
VAGLSGCAGLLAPSVFGKSVLVWVWNIFWLLVIDVFKVEMFKFYGENVEVLPDVEFEKVEEEGNMKVMLTERGNTFGYQDLIVDFRGLPVMQSYDATVVLDCTHSLQQPNQNSGVTGGRPALIETIARAGIAVGADGLFIETHPNPAEAKSDGANMLPLDRLEALLERLVRIKKAIQA